MVPVVVDWRGGLKIMGRTKPVEEKVTKVQDRGLMPETLMGDNLWLGHILRAHTSWDEGDGMHVDPDGIRYTREFQDLGELQ